MGAQNERRPQQGRRPPKEETPTSMVFLAVMVGVMGIVSLLAGLGVTVLGSLFNVAADAGSQMASEAGSVRAQQAANEAQTAATFVTITGFVQIVTAVIKFAGVYGVFKAKDWALYLLAGTFTFDVLQNVVGFAGIGPISWGTGIGVMSLLIFVSNAAILAVLLTNQDYFGTRLFGGSSQPARV